MHTSLIRKALQKLIKNQAAGGDFELLRQAFVNGQIFIGGNVQNSVIIVGSGNSVQLTPEVLKKLAATNSLSSLHQLPQPPADFVGREKELKRILAAIHRKEGAAISGLVGMGGIGKTALGLVVVHHLVKQYPDAQIFIDLRGGTKEALKAEDVMKHVVQSFDSSAKLRKINHSELNGRYHSTLADRRAILFFDNAHNAAQVAHLLPPSNCFTLVTSRWHFTVPGLQSIELDALKEKSAVQLLMEICPRIAEKDAQRIAKLCAYLPLALRLAGSYLRIHKDWTPQDYITELSDKSKRLQTLEVEGADANIIASFEQSYEQLSAERKRYWSMLAIFPAAFKRDALTSVWGVSSETTRKLIDAFLQNSLLEYDRNVDRYYAHDLLSDFARTKLTDDDKKLSSIYFLRHYQNVWKTSEELYAKGGKKISKGLSLFDAEFTHIEAAYQWAKEHIESDTEVSDILKEFPDIHSVASLRVHPKMMLEWVQTALIAARRNEDLYNQNVLLGNIGAAYIDMGEYEQSIPYSEQALQLARNINDEKHEAIWLGHIGIAYSDQGRSHKGIEYLEPALKIATRLGNLAHQGDCLNNLAVAYSNLGDTHTAIEYLKRSAKIAHKTRNLQREHKSKGNIGAGFVSLGENRKAIQFLNQALKITRKLKDRKLEGFWSGTLGMAYTNLGEYDKALACLNEALKHAREVSQRRDEHNWLGNLGVAYIGMGKYREAKKYLDQALKIVREIGDRQSEGDWLGNVGVIYANLGEYPKAKRYLERSLAISVEVDAKWQQAQWQDQLGELYIKMNDTLQANQYLDRALMISREFEIREIEGRSLFNLAKLSQLNGNKELALQYAQAARLIFEIMEFPLLEKVIQFIENLD